MKAPTDIVNLFKKKIEQWNKSNKCGYCWEFSAPLRVSDLNEYQQRGEDCCVHVFLTNLRGNETNYRPAMSYTIAPTRQFATVYFLMKDNIGVNVYNEIDGHPISESKWETILKKIFECIFHIDFCDINENILIEGISWQTKIDWQDSNYTGWQFDFTFNELLE